MTTRWNSTRNCDSSQLTALKQTRNIYANALAQRTAIDKAGKPFMNLQSASVGQGSTTNIFSVAVDTGGVNLSQAEFDAIVAQETPGASEPSGPPPPPPPPTPVETLTFTWTGSAGTQLPGGYTIPEGYTSLTYIIRGGGGGGSGCSYNSYPGSGGGSGGYMSGTITISPGTSLSITSFGLGGQSGTGIGGIPQFGVVNALFENGSNGGDTGFQYGSDSFVATGGGGGSASQGGAAGTPGGSQGSAYANNSAGDGGSGGGGGGGGGGGLSGGFGVTVTFLGGNGGLSEDEAQAGNGETPSVKTYPDSRWGEGGNGGRGYYSLILT